MSYRKNLTRYGVPTLTAMLLSTVFALPGRPMRRPHPGAMLRANC